MKKGIIVSIVLIISILSVVLAVVVRKPKDVSASLMKTAPESIKTESVVVKDSLPCGSEICSSSLEMEFPVNGNFLVISSIQEWMSEMLGGTYTGKLSDSKKMAKYYTQKTMNDFKKELKEWNNGVDMAFTEEHQFKKVYETDKFVTYQYTNYSYWGGAHGSSGNYCQTFRKTDGRRMDWNVFRPDALEQVRAMVEKELKVQFFNESTEEDLEMLSNYNQGFTPLPKGNPVFVEEGVMFVYQQYEIAPYAWGLPTCTVPYDALNSLFSYTGKSLIVPDAIAEK